MKLTDQEIQRLLYITADLISLKSDASHGTEEAIGNYIYHFLDALGIETKRQMCAPQRFNVVARIPGKNHGRCVMYSGHMDVVPAGEEKPWTSPPYMPQLRDGCLYGRGACDMKGSLACILFMLEYFSQHRITPASDLLFVFDVDEEIANLGIKTFLKNPPAVNFCIVGEPTDLNVCIGHRGVAAFTVNLFGKSCHAGKWQLGKNPVYTAGRLIQKLEELQTEYVKQKQPYLGSASIQVTQIYGGERVNVIPDQVTLRIDRRLVGKETLKHAERELLDLLEQIKRQDQIAGELAVTTYCPPGYTEASHPELIRMLRILAQAGHDSVQKGFDASCEAGLLQESLGIPVIIFGPGSIDQAHQIDEFVRVSSLKRGAELYMLLFQEL